jgi:hypothetical protein
MRDLISNVSPAILIPSQTAAADTTPSSIDLQGYDAAAIYIEVGIGGITFSGTNKIEFVLTHSDDDSTYSNVADADLQGVSGTSSGIVYSLTAAHAAGTVTEIGYVGGKRYLKLLADFSGTHGTGTPLSALCIRGRAANRPAA